VLQKPPTQGTVQRVALEPGASRKSFRARGWTPATTLVPPSSPPAPRQRLRIARNSLLAITSRIPSSH